MSTQTIPAVPLEQNASPTFAANWPARYASFGKFLLDLHREELYQDGRRVKIQGKVAQILLVLVNHAGELLTREQVRQSIWPETILSDLDANVNTAINKLRKILGDSSDNPIYIETIQRRGYCFKAPVEFSNVATNVTKTPQVPGNPSGDTLGESPRVPRAPHWARSLFHVLSLFVAAILMGALMLLAWSFISEKNQRHVNSGEKLGPKAVSKAVPPRSALPPIA